MSPGLDLPELPLSKEGWSTGGLKPKGPGRLKGCLDLPGRCPEAKLSEESS